MFTLGSTNCDNIFRFLYKAATWNSEPRLSTELYFQMNIMNLTWICTSPATEMNLQITSLSNQISWKSNQRITWDTAYPSVSISSSPEDICLVSGNESRLPEPASTRPSDDKFNAPVADDDPKNRRTGASAEDDAERLYVKIPIGWSNLQLGPNLHMP